MQVPSARSQERNGLADSSVIILWSSLQVGAGNSVLDVGLTWNYALPFLPRANRMHVGSHGPQTG